MSLILKNKTHCILLRPTALYLANSALKSVLGIFLNIWLGNFLTALGNIAAAHLVLQNCELHPLYLRVQVPTRDILVAQKLLGNFVILWLGILLGNLYLRKVVGKNCELRPLYLHVQVLTRNISSGLGIVRKFGDLVVRNFCSLGKPLEKFLLGHLFPIRKIYTIVLFVWCIFTIRQTQ